MANCELGLVSLPCDRSGTGFTARPLDIESNRLHLVKGHANTFQLSPMVSISMYESKDVTVAVKWQK